MRKIITEKCPVGFKSFRDEFDLGDQIGTGKTEKESIENLIDLEDLNSNVLQINEGYKAFNGYVFTASDAKNYNETYCKNDDERHRLFCNIIGL